MTAGFIFGPLGVDPATYHSRPSALRRAVVRSKFLWSSIVLILSQTMSMKRLSPTANLLRTSRIFSLPPPLPKPSAELSATSTSESETATLPYPINASIQTTESSLGRGDWGLKRPLPLKSTTRSSTPTIHIDNIDSIDHITDFDSAADHVLTLRKWQELDMPISLGETQRTATGASKPSRSVFDSQYDNTHFDGRTQSEDSPTKLKRQRWKYGGPWLAGQSDIQFQEYVRKVKNRRTDFRQFAQTKLATIKAAARRREAVEEGTDAEIVEVSVAQEEVDNYIKRLRNDENAMQKVLEEFLDLPRNEVQAHGGGVSDRDEKGPPTTHPSAGLSYLRTGSRIFNHPTFGPQASETPVEGRVVAPQKIQGRTQARALIGVSGVVAVDSRYTFTKTDELPGLASFDPDVPGGAKLWVNPRRAVVGSQGKIELIVDRATKNAVNIARGLHSEEVKPREAPPGAAITAALHDRATPTLTSDTPRTRRSNQGYGVEDLDVQGRNGRAKPFLGLEDGGSTSDQKLNELLGASLRGSQTRGS